MANTIQKNSLKIQKLVLAFWALATVCCVSGAVFAKHKNDTKNHIVGTVGALLGGLGMGLATNKSLSNRCKE